MFGKDFPAEPYQNESSKNFDFVFKEMPQPVSQNCPAKRHDKSYTAYDNCRFKNGSSQKSKTYAHCKGVYARCNG